MTCQTYNLFVLSVIMIYYGHTASSLNLVQLQDDIDKLKADFVSIVFYCISLLLLLLVL